MATIASSREPYVLTPGQLSTSLLVTTGAITKRIDRLEARGLAQRTVSPADSRGRLVTLTPAGVELADEFIGVHLTNEARLLAGLSAQERAQLATLLARLAETIETIETVEDVEVFEGGGQR